MSEESLAVSVVLPAYNEEDTIERTVRVTLETLEAFLPGDAFEVIVAEDGCDDRTPDIADDLAAADARVRHFHSDERLGRGGALERAFRASDGETLVYFDTDLATDMRHLEELVESVRSGEYDVATGSRWLPENVADRPPRRDVASRGFNRLVRTLLRSEVRDHQCGFKAFDRDVLFSLLDDVQDQHWFWDTEVLVRAQRRGYRIKEFSVDWEPKGDTKVDLVRDVFGMGSQILRVFYEFSIQPHANRRTGMVAGFLMLFAAVGLMFFYLDPRAVFDAMATADVRLVALAGAVFVVSWPIRGLRYRDILLELGYREGVPFLTGAVFISQLGNLVFPARAGDGVRAYVVKARRRVPYTTGFASLTVERVFDLLSLTLLAGGVLVGFAVFAPEQIARLAGALAGGDAPGNAPRQSAQVAVVVASLVGAGVVVLVATILVTARSERNRIRPIVEWASDDSYVEYVASALETFVRDVQAVAVDRGVLARVTVASLLVWMLDATTGLIVFYAFGVDLPLATLFVVGFFAVSVGNLSKVLPLSPGGTGLYEGAFTVLVVALTPVTPEVALAVAIVDHFTKHFVTLTGGVASLVLLNVSLTEAVEATEDIDAEASPQAVEN